ncbi:MAG TPA: ACP S-malonyltransferase [Candidatus Limnocylindrales bacterium]|nr:ACP S-malonyltransferase [Candidatus Limnocylindrales bacterium]
MSLALLFSPQGSQVVGMGRELAETSAAARAVFDEADATLGWSVSDLCWNGPRERLDDTRQTQPCLLATSVAALRALEESALQVAPGMVAGHSVGEYAALVAAGVLDFAAALRLTARRGELMASSAGDGTMSAVLGLDRETVEEIVTAVGRPTELVVANDNAPGQVVISGRLEAVEAAEEAARAAGARRCLRLPVSGAFHSPLMADVADALADAFEAETWRDARVPVVSNVTAEPLTEASRIRSLLAEQVRSPVEWVRVVDRMARDGIEAMIECGPGAALTGMVRRIAPGVQTATVGDAASLAEAADLAAARAGASVS